MTNVFSVLAANEKCWSTPRSSRRRCAIRSHRIRATCWCAGHTRQWHVRRKRVTLNYYGRHVTRSKGHVPRPRSCARRGGRRSGRRVERPWLSCIRRFESQGGLYKTCTFGKGCSEWPRNGRKSFIRVYVIQRQPYALQLATRLPAKIILASSFTRRQCLRTPRCCGQGHAGRPQPSDYTSITTRKSFARRRLGERPRPTHTG
jgi:hypothetical protein